MEIDQPPTPPPRRHCLEGNVPPATIDRFLWPSGLGAAAVTQAANGHKQAPLERGRGVFHPSVECTCPPQTAQRCRIGPASSGGEGKCVGRKDNVPDPTVESGDAAVTPSPDPSGTKLT